MKEYLYKMVKDSSEVTFYENHGNGQYKEVKYNLTDTGEIDGKIDERAIIKDFYESQNLQELTGKEF
jgi:hypothetical protein